MKRKFTTLASILILALVIISGTLFLGKNYNQKVLSAYDQISTKKVCVTSPVLSVHNGAGTQFPVITQIYKGQTIDITNQIGNWYVIRFNDKLGKISANFATPVTTPKPAPIPAPSPVSSPKPAPKPVPVPAPSSTPAPASNQLTSDQSQMLNLINAERTKLGGKALQFDSELAKVANIKAKDMVDNNYFSHTSPTYGSPFDMMKSFGIHYFAAGENLAGNSGVEKAHYALMNSEGHRKNILNPNFTNIGIGIAKSPTYGYVFVQMFIGK